MAEMQNWIIETIDLSRTYGDGEGQFAYRSR
jgi:hypothetical protein